MFNLVWLFLIVYSLQVKGGELGPLTYEIADGQVTITGCNWQAKGELEIPAEIEGVTVTSIGGRAFSGCSSLTSIEVAPLSSSYVSIEGVLFTKEGSSLIQYPARKEGDSYVIPDSVTSIGDVAFRGSSLRSITIPDSVTSIGDRAFSGCSYLTSIIIPQSVTSIETFAFFNCSSLTSIVIPQAFHSRSEANRLKITHLWPDGFFLPSSITHTPKLSIRLPLQLILTGDENTKAAIEATDTLTGPWTEWRTIVIGENGTTEVDLDEGAEQRFYRVRN
ncbi:leucine-rich repeat domain-containing protein [Verrucomicrobia bacterium]|nr:leucine-rich repeat domain-containing protein [Verrucomicrobiota bacterium]